MSAVMESVDFLATARSSYERLHALCREDVTWPADPVLAAMLAPLMYEMDGQLERAFELHSQELLGEVLPEFGVAPESPLWKQLAGLRFYPRGISAFISDLLFWMWEDGVGVTGL